MRYEVRCRKCGECYGEDSRPGAALAVAAAEPPIQWPPDCEPVPARDWRDELRDRWSVASERSKTELDVMGRRAQVFLEHGREWFNGRRSARKVDQTGG